jgi:multiple sugar transport system permease protein
MTPRIGARVTVWAALVVVVGVALVPIGYLVSLSVRPPGDVLNSSLVPSEWTTWNFVSVFHTIALDTMLGNSWVSAVGAALLAVVIAVPAAYFTADGFAASGC